MKVSYASPIHPFFPMLDKYAFLDKVCPPPTDPPTYSSDQIEDFRARLREGYNKRYRDETAKPSPDSNYFLWLGSLPCIYYNILYSNYTYDISGVIIDGDNRFYFVQYDNDAYRASFCAVSTEPFTMGDIDGPGRCPNIEIKLIDYRGDCDHVVFKVTENDPYPGP